MVDITISGATKAGDIYTTNTNTCLFSISGVHSILSYSFAKQYSISGSFQGYAYPMNATEDGSYSITMNFRDLAGFSVHSLPITVYVETIKPFITYMYVSNSSYVNGIYYTTSGSLQFGASGELPFLSYFYNADGPYPLSSSTMPFLIPLQTYADGTYNISIALKNAANTTDPSSITVVVISQLPSAPILTILDPINRNLSGTTTHYSTATLSVSGTAVYTYHISLNGASIASGSLSLSGIFSKTITNLSGSQSVTATLTDPIGNTSSPTSIAWTVKQFSDAPMLTLHPSQNSLSIDVSGETETSYLLTLSGTNVRSYPGTISGLFTLNIENLFYGPILIAMSITNYAGYTTYSIPIFYTVPLVLSASGTTLTWNGHVSTYNVYRYNTDTTATRIATTANPSYDVSPYSGLTLTFYVETNTQQTSNRITLTLPVNTQALQSILPTEYITAAFTSDISSSTLRSFLNSYDASSSISFLPSGVTKISPIPGLPDTSFAVVVGPPGSTIQVDTSQLSGIPAIYIASAPNTTKTFVFDNSYSLTITFDTTSIRIGNATYSAGDTIIFGNDTYLIVWFGSVFLKRIYITNTNQDSNVRTLSIRELRSANVQPTGTNVAEYIGGRELVRQVLSKGRQQQFQDYSFYMRYLKGRAYIQGKK